MKKLFSTFALLIALSLAFSSAQVALADDGTPTPQTGSSNSGSAGQNKAALRLAQKYGVSYDEIMGWKAEGHGFGEIDKAYGLLAKTKDQGTTVAGFFALRDGGKGWGQIAKIYGVSLKGNNGSGDKADSHDNGGGKGNKGNKGNKGDKQNGDASETETENDSGNGGQP
ncbi:MAG: hypothetical protein AAB427_13245 [Chloroflexota bacterium]